MHSYPSRLPEDAIMFLRPQSTVTILLYVTSWGCNQKSQQIPHTFLGPFQKVPTEGKIMFSSVQSLSHVWLIAIPWSAARQASLPITNSQSLLKLMFIELVMPSNHLILCCPPLLLPSIFPSIRAFLDKMESCHYKPMPAQLKKKKKKFSPLGPDPLSAEMLQLVLFNKLWQLGKKIQSIKCYIKTTVKLQVKTDNWQNPAFKSNFLGRPWFCNVQHILIPSPERG